MPPKSSKSKSPRKSSGAKTSGKKPSAGRSLKALFAILFLLGFLVLSLVYLSQMRRHPASEAPSAPPAPERKIGSDHRPEVQPEEPQPAEPPAEVTEPEPPPKTVERPPATLGERERPLLPPPPARVDGAPVRVAIVMDDLGRDMSTGHALVSLGIPVTFAILPDQRQTRRLADFAHENGQEVIIHIPMEPRGYPVNDPGETALFVDLSADEVRMRMRDFIALVPHAVGGNNHMGSRFTESREGMQAALSVMKEEDLFFVDSYTSPQSVAFDEARQAGIPFAVRNVFLDNVQDVGAITAQIEKLIRVAQERGQAVGICHPHAQTLTALRQAAPEFARLGIEVVPVSALLQR